MQSPPNTTREAWFTLLVGNEYVASLLGFMHALKTHGTERPFHVLASQVSDSNLEKLSAYGFQIVPTQTVTTRTQYPHSKFMLTKLLVWSFTEFDKIVFTDADAMPLGPIDELFSFQGPFAAPPATPPGVYDPCFHAGLFLVEPSTEEYEFLIKHPEYRQTNEQQLLNQVYYSGGFYQGEGRGWKELPFEYCVCDAYHPGTRMYHWAYREYRPRPWSVFPDAHFEDIQSDRTITWMNWRRALYLLWWRHYFGAYLDLGYSVEDAVRNVTFDASLRSRGEHERLLETKQAYLREKRWQRSAFMPLASGIRNQAHDLRTSILPYGKLLLRGKKGESTEHRESSRAQIVSRTRKGWSIGMYVGNTPFDFGEPFETDPSKHRNPVLWRDDIQLSRDGGKPIYLADPFLIQHGAQTYLFFEILFRFSPLSARYEKGAIGYAVCEDLEKQKWRYQGIALEEPFHLSYPHVFEHEGQMFMIPETHEKRSVRLYQAQSFPARWTFKKDLLGQNGYFADSGVVYYQDYWWLFTYGPDRRLLVFYSRDLLGPYLPHAGNPVVRGGRDYQRPAGRLLVWNGNLYRFSQQEGLAGYGSLVHAHEITELSPEKYVERPMFGGERFLPTDSSLFRSCWNRKTHHVDFLQLGDGQWLVAVDGDDRPCEGDPMQVSHYDGIRYAFRSVKASVKVKAEEQLRSLGLRSPFRDPD